MKTMHMSKAQANISLHQYTITLALASPAAFACLGSLAGLRLAPQQELGRCSCKIVPHLLCCCHRGRDLLPTHIQAYGPVYDLTVRVLREATELSRVCGLQTQQRMLEHDLEGLPRHVLEDGTLILHGPLPWV